ncbi:serine acetyltransferase [Marivirga sp.]|uniref:serine O-acetyltransferase n=1 Tax=Marivirga sp. TaxID=2018662 RepID=UPI0025E73E78|nr:serine acetyltransferase [Marivirga sp.]
MKKFKLALIGDLYRYQSSFLKALFVSPGFRFCVYFRLSQSFSIINPLGLVGRILLKITKVKYGFQIPHRTKIGYGFYIGHFGNIVINQKVILGNNCNIAQGVTIGEVNRGIKKGTPVIGNQVWIGANSVIVGNIKIGDNVLIAPLAFVNFDIPDDAVVSGNPAKIINYKGSKNYINNIVK